MRTRTVTVVADDLIWASRLRAAAERAGATIAAADGDAALVDLGLRRADAVAVVAELAGRGVPVLAVGQHDDLPLRKRALAAGATRVYSYNKVFTDGPALIGRWLAGLP